MTRPLVVVVDDEASVGRSTTRLLRSVGIDAEWLLTGNELLSRLAAAPSYRPDCLILDVHMPGLTGLELQQQLAGSGLPIIFITAYDDIGVRERAVHAGAAAFLRKPFDDQALIGAVQSALKVTDGS